jgi:hypothetical protein
MQENKHFQTLNCKTLGLACCDCLYNSRMHTVLCSKSQVSTPFPIVLHYTTKHDTASTGGALQHTTRLLYH